MEREINRRGFLRMSAGLAASVAVAACTPQPAAEGPPQTAAPQPQAASNTFRAWIAWPEDYAAVHFMRETEFPQLVAKHPNIAPEVSYINWREIARKFVETKAAGAAPDFTDLSENQGSMVYLGFLYDLKELAQNWGVYDDFYPAVIDFCETNGKLFQLPMYYGTKCDYINRQVWEEAGLDPDNPPQTWEAFQEAAIQLTKRTADGGWERVGYDRVMADGGSYETFSGRYLAQNGQSDFDPADPFMGKCMINTEVGLETISWFCDLVRVHEVFPLRGGAPWPAEVTNPVLEGYLGIGETGPWWVPNFREAHPEILESDLIQVLLPMERKQRAGNMDCQTVGVNADSDVLEVALDFAEIYIADENYKGMYMSPDPAGDPVGKCWMTTGRKSINEAPDFWIANEPLVKDTAFLEALNYGVSPARLHVGYIEYVEEVMIRALEQMLYQQKPDQEILDEAAQKADEIAERTAREWS